jgi:hypothetical protein
MFRNLLFGSETQEGTVSSSPILEVLMKLSAPIHELKSEAKRLKRTGAMPMVAALNHIAQREGFASWSLLQARAGKRPLTRIDQLFDQLTPGDMVLLAARPLRRRWRRSTRISMSAVWG